MISFKKIAAASLAAAMLLGALAGCGKKNVTYADPEHIFTQEEIIIPGNYDYVSQSKFLNGKIYVLATGSETKIVPAPDMPEGIVPPSVVPLVRADNLVAETAVVSDYDAANETQYASDGSIIPDGMMEVYINNTILIVMDENGNKLNEKIIASTGEDPNSDLNIWYNYLDVSPEGNLISTKTVNSGFYDDMGNYNSNSQNTIVSFDENLNESTYFDLSTAMDNIPDSETLDKNVQPNSFLFDNTGKVYLLTYQGMFVFERATGKYIYGVITQEEGKPVTEYYGTLFMLDGQPAVYSQKYSNEPDNYEMTSTLKFIDADNKTFTTEYPFDAAANFNPQPGNADYPIIMVSAAKLYSYDWKTQERSLLIDFLASGVNVNGYGSILIINKDTFATVETTWGGGGMGRMSEPTTKMTFFRRVDPATVGKRELVTIYSFYPDYNLMQFAADYNKKSTEYIVDVKAYNEDYSGERDDVISKLNNDILSGNIPDILSLDSAMPFDSYAAKGLFYDLNKYLEKDEELTRDSMNESVLNALSTNGKLYSLTRNFSVTGLLGKKSIFGDAKKLTAENMKAATAKFPDAELIGYTTREGFIGTMISNQINTYVDKESGTVSFNSPEFIELLNIAKTYPEKIDDNFDYSYYDNMYRNNSALLNTMYLSNFRAINDVRYQSFGEEVTFMGFPGETGSGIMMTPSTELSIMSGGNRDAAWEVLKAYMTEESDSDVYQFSIFNDSTAKLAETAKVPQSYEDYETGEKIEYPNTYYVNGEEFTYPDNTEADNQYIYDIINNIEGVSRADTELMKIIEEETAAFFAGSKTAEQCANLIEDRASTYVAESR